MRQSQLFRLMPRPGWTDRKWGAEAERQIDRGETPTLARTAKLRTFGGLIDLHIADMKEAGEPPRRPKAATLDMLKRRLGSGTWPTWTARGS
jgi:hypothetical protein